MEMKSEKEKSVESIEVQLSPQLEEEDAQKKKKIFTPKKIKILASVVYGNLFLGSCYSLMAPFFPAEAERKGASATEYGLVFGVYQLIMFLASPIYGKLIPILKPGFLMKAGMLVSGICVIIFGHLNYAPAGRAFVGLAFTVRIIDALGAAAFLTASYTTLGCELPEIIGRAMSLTETAFAFGLAGGPVLGGVLYQAGGFTLPFLVVGLLLLTGTAVNFFLFTDVEEVSGPPSSARKLLADSGFLINVLTISTCFAMLGFNEATLEPHIREFHLSPTAVGAIFLISGLTDALSAIVWGYFAERVANAQYLTVLACFFFLICFLIVGPVRFMPFPTILWVVIVSQFLLGLGMAGEIVCSMTHGMKATVERGFPDDVATYGLVSGVLFSSACFGAFIGPSVGGFLIDQVGYEDATAVILGMQVLVTILTSARVLWDLKQRRKRKREETAQDPT